MRSTVPPRRRSRLTASTSGASMRTRVSLTTEATFTAAAPAGVAALTTWATSWTLAPTQVPKVAAGTPPQLSRICFVAWDSSGTVTYSHFCMAAAYGARGYPPTA